MADSCEYRIFNSPSGEFHPPIPFFKFIPEVARYFESRNMNADVGGQVTEDSMVGLGFAARPFTVALERLDLQFEARFDGSLPDRPAETVGTLEIARHDIPDLAFR
ncbi:hypothetical protein N7478_010557 [Penicillium angulare]|uniref:uncharacterized protein n=1 Tax=Penicillium angulare TaxID=116970 RepID=UPI00253FFC36|nr:uncharacterized protein N7478_010557 [Penicillium angulare]KAJ5267749.1 hypothetical protein N7478_010557 [Penicillium angulare]